MKQTTIRIALALACLAGAGLALPSNAAAQAIEEGKKSTDKDTTEESRKRLEERTKRLDVDKKDAEGAQSGGPTADLKQFEDEGQKLTPEQIDAIKRKLESKNAAMIKKLDRIIAGDPYNDSMPEWMFQKAELVWELRNWEYLRERAKYNQCMDAAASKGTVDENACQEPVANYSEAQTIYKDILTKYPSYNRLDEVIYRLGRGLIEAGQGAQAVNYLQRLVKNYPQSKYIPEAHLALGEFFFEKEVLGLARDNYKKLLEPQYKGNNLVDYARYKLGWVYFNQQEYRASIDTFKSVVESTEDKVGFQNQAINDLVLAFAEVDGGWKEAREYLKTKKGDEFMYKKLGQMAGLYEMQGKDPLAVEIYEWFINTKKNDPRVPQWAEAIIVAQKKEVNDHDGLEKQMNRFVAYFSPKGTWWAQNKSNDGALNNATLLVDASLAYLSNYFHRKAQETGEVPLYKKAADYYVQYIDRFPDSVAAFDMNFFLGEILLLNLKEYEKAANQYQKVVDLYKNDKVPEGAKKEDVDAIVKDSAYAVVTAYNELVKEKHPDSILVKMAEYDEKEAERRAKERQNSTEDKPNPKVPLLKYEEGFVKASDQYSEMYPKEDVTPTVDFVAAEVYKARGHYDKAVPRYESIIQNAPKHKYASFAGNSLLEANYRLERWGEVEKWGRHLLKNKIFDVTPKEKLESAIVFAINEDARDLSDAGKPEEAVKRWVALAEEFPKSQYAPSSLFNAAAAYEKADNVNKAVEFYEKVVKEYPENYNAPQSIVVMGKVYQSRANFEKAAEYYERMASTAPYKTQKGEDAEYKDHPEAAAAIYDAALIREAMQQWDNAIASYTKYIELYPEEDNVRDVIYKLPYIEKSKEDFKKSYERFEKLTKRDDVKKTELVEINTQLGLLEEEMKGKGWEKKSDDYFTKAVKLWNELEAEDKKSTKYYAAQSRFLQAERLFKEFQAVKLSFPLKTLTKKAQEKGEIEQNAEKMYFEVVDMASPLWLAASAYRIGQMYKEFSDQLYALPIPDGLNEDLQFQYQNALDELAFPLQEKALSSFRNALKLALQYKAYNEWSRKSAEAISKLESEAYPITGEDGVAADHGRVNFSQPRPVTKLEVVKERVLRRKKNAKPAPAPAAPAAGEQAGETKASK